LHLSDPDYHWLTSFFGAYDGNVARCRYAPSPKHAFVPEKFYGDYGGEVSMDNVQPDGKRRVTATIGDRAAQRSTNSLNSLSNRGRLTPDGAHAREYREALAEEERTGTRDDSIQHDDDSDSDSEEDLEDGEYREGAQSVADDSEKEDDEEQSDSEEEESYDSELDDSD